MTTSLLKCWTLLYRLCLVFILYSFICLSNFSSVAFITINSANPASWSYETERRNTTHPICILLISWYLPLIYVVIILLLKDKQMRQLRWNNSGILLRRMQQCLLQGMWYSFTQKQNEICPFSRSTLFEKKNQCFSWNLHWFIVCFNRLIDFLLFSFCFYTYFWWNPTAANWELWKVLFSWKVELMRRSGLRRYFLGKTILF